MDSSSIIIEASGYSYYQYTVTKEMEYSPLDRNDPVYMDENTDQNGVAMKLMDVEWSAQQITHVAGSPVPTVYRGNAIYQGLATGRKADGYIVTASYIGEIAKVTPGNVQYTVIFRGALIEPEPFNPVPVVAASSTAAGGIFYAVFFFWLKRDAKIYNLQNGQYVLVDKQRIKAASPVVDLSGLKHKTMGGGFLVSLDKSIAEKLNGMEINITNGLRQLQHLFDNPGGGAYQFEISL